MAFSFKETVFGGLDEFRKKTFKSFKEKPLLNLATAGALGITEGAMAGGMQAAEGSGLTGEAQSLLTNTGLIPQAEQAPNELKIKQDARDGRRESQRRRTIGRASGTILTQSNQAPSLLG